MNIIEIIETLRVFNEWRRFDGPIGEAPEQLSPKEIGEAIDGAVELLSKKSNTTIETIRAEVERRKLDSLNHGFTFVPTAMQSLLEYLDTLQEQPVCEGLEDEIYKEKAKVARLFGGVTGEQDRALIELARHFYELGRQSLKDKDTFDEVDDAILELVIRAVRERKDEDTGYENHYDRLLNWLGELPNWVRCKPEVSEDLEEEINRCIYKPFFDLDGVAVKGATYYLTVEDVADIARHFAKWQKEQMMKEAVEGEVISISDNGWESIRIPKKIHKCGDKVKFIIIVKEEGK